MRFLSVQPVPPRRWQSRARLFPTSPRWSIFPAPGLGCAPSLSRIHGESGPSAPGPSSGRAGGGCARTVPAALVGQDEPRPGGCQGGPGRAAVGTVLPVPHGERQMDGDTQGPASHRDRILHLLGSDVRPVRSWCHWLHRCRILRNPFLGGLTLLTPPHPRSAASQAPRAEPSTSGGDEGCVRARRDTGEWHRVHPEFHPLGSGEGAGPGASCQGGRAAPTLRLLKAVGRQEHRPWIGKG